MTAAKFSRPLPRTPAYIEAIDGAYELSISVDTWHKLVKQGIIPPPIIITDGLPRWRWEDVDTAVAARVKKTQTETHTPFFNVSSAAGVEYGTTQETRRGAAARGPRSKKTQ